MLLYYARHALRLLVREPGFTMAALLTLALGVGANVAVFAVVEAVLLRPLPYADADRLAIVKHRDQSTGFVKQDVAIGDYVDLTARQSAFEFLAGYGSGQGLVFGLGEPFRVSTLSAGPGRIAMIVIATNARCVASDTRNAGPRRRSRITAFGRPRPGKSR